MYALTEEQKKAAEFLEADQMIIAAAGSGKTRVLIEKVSRILQKGIPLERIAVVTFSEKAGIELKERMGRNLDQQQSPIGTIHSLAAMLLRRFGEGFGINPSFEVLDEPLSFLARERSLREGFLNLLEQRDPHVLSLIEEFGFARSIPLLQDLMDRRHDRPSRFEPLRKILKNRYEEAKRAQNQMDFDDLEDRLLHLLRQEKFRNLCIASFSWILVDEFQDTNPVQWQILSQLHDPSRNRLVVVGDPRQAIYRFRGADLNLFLQLEKQFSEQGRVFTLTENFRSAPPVVDLVNRIVTPLFGPAYRPMVARGRAVNGGWEILPLPETDTIDERRVLEAEAVAGRIDELVNGGYQPGEIALLFRTRKAIPYFEKALRARGISYQTKAGESLLERKEILPLLFLLRRVARPDDAIAREGLLRSRLANLEVEVPLLREQPVEDFLTTFRDKLFSTFPDAVERANMVLFFQLLGRLTAIGAKNLADWVKSLEILRKEEARIPATETTGSRDAVQILTVHGSKGLEFRVLFLCDLSGRTASNRGLFVPGEEGTMHLKERDRNHSGLKEKFLKTASFEEAEAKEKVENLEETKRLLYVGLTRAIEKIIFPLETGKKRAKGDWPEWIAPHVLDKRN